MFSDAMKSRIMARRGLSLVEVLISLAITAVLLTATMAAIDASFKAYGDAVENASTQTATRMIVNRVLSMVRTSTAHGPLEAVPADGVILTGDIITSPYIELIDAGGQIVRIEYDDVAGTMNLVVEPGTAAEQSYPMIDNVVAAEFALRRRTNRAGLLVLERATVDITVQPAEDKTLSVENGATVPVRMIASTMPRKVAP